MDPTILGALLGGILATVGGVLGGVVTGWFALKSNRQSLVHEVKRERERGLSFRQQQLSQFYGPAQACMEELEESWHLLHEANKNVEKFSQSYSGENPAGQDLADKQMAVLEYKQYLYAKEVAVFNKIKDIFISNFGLAEPSTKENYRSLVRFIENRNIINVTERKLDITFTGEASSGLRDKIASLFRNLIDISGQIRSQLEHGEPKPIVEPSNERQAMSPEESEIEQLISAREPKVVEPPVTVFDVQPQTKAEPSLAPSMTSSAETAIPSRHNWPGRYTLLANKDSLDLAPKATKPAE